MLPQRNSNWQGFEEYRSQNSYIEKKSAPSPVKKRGSLHRVQLNRVLRSRAQIAFVIISVLAMAVVVRSGISASRGYALVGIQQQVINLEQENERLKVEIAKLKSPARIREIAISELGMEIPQKMYFSHDR
ncbi:MAG: cell division protein FtsL [Selenomonadaceae bacterium]|nr:cell division protein FtsL [Selenomonadaceae bacterium]